MQPVPKAERKQPTRRPRQAERLMLYGCLAVIVLAALTLHRPTVLLAMALFDHVPLLTKSAQKHLNPFRTRHALVSSGLPVYDLKIKPDEYRKVLDVVERAKQRGELTDDLKVWSKAAFIHNGVTRRVKVRVRGDLPRHWNQEQKSWRVRFPKDDPFEGMHELNLIILGDNKGLEERFTNDVFRRLGLMTLRDGYAVLRINGVMQGVYYQVEHIDDALLAHHRRPKSTVFRNPRYGVDPASFDEQITTGADTAWQALQMLLDYERWPTSQHLQAALAVTDVDDYLKFIAGTTLFCSDHSSFASDNHKLYYDASRGMFYRIPWDIRALELPDLYFHDLEDMRATIDVFRFQPMSKLRLHLITDESLRLRRNRILWDLVEDDTLLTRFDETYRDVRPALWANITGTGDELDRLESFRLRLENNIEAIRKSLSGDRIEVCVRHEAPGIVSIEIAVNNLSGIHWQGLQVGGGSKAQPYTLYRDENHDGVLDQGDQRLATSEVNPRGDVRLEGFVEHLYPEMEVLHDHPTYFFRKPVRTVVHPKTKRFWYLLEARRGGVIDDSISDLCFQTINAVTGQRIDDRLHIRTYRTAPDFDVTRRLATRAEFLRNHPNFHEGWGEGSDWVVLPAGRHEFHSTVVVPRGVALRIDAGAELVLDPGVSVVSFGQVLAEGTREQPIRIISNGQGAWGTFAIVQTEAMSILRHVEVEHGGGASVDGIEFTGALALHDADVRIENSSVRNCSAEDAVNIKNSRLTLENLLTADNAGDGVDLDFAEGTIRRCQFVRHGGDGIDLAGSNVLITGSRIEYASDKGISIGEESSVRLVDNLLIGNLIGIAVKDSSEAHIEHCTMIGNETSIAAYRKKPIFGGGRAYVRSSLLLDSATPLAQDSFSEIELEDSPLTGNMAAELGVETGGDWLSKLRRQDFVLEPTDLIQSAGERGGGSRSRRPGLLSPAVDLAS